MTICFTIDGDTTIIIKHHILKHHILELPNNSKVLDLNVNFKFALKPSEHLHWKC